ncbi:MAG: PIN domain-containing protein, partial [Armatimonadetes bacterium]|nr:PIN domain-containing protein [Armatimonadota bacterium]
MSTLSDTNILARRILPDDPQYHATQHALDLLRQRGETLHVTPQNLVEFRALATRPMEANGLGFTSQQASEEANEIERLFPLLHEMPDIYPLWRDLVDAYGVVGRQVYDARLVAIMLAHGVTHLLTFNAAHFRRFTEITVVTPPMASPAATPDL